MCHPERLLQFKHLHDYQWQHVSPLSLRKFWNKKEEAYKSGLQKCKEGSEAVKSAKQQYKNKLQQYFSAGDCWLVWKRLQTCTDCKSKPQKTTAEPSLPNTLNTFLQYLDLKNKGCVLMPVPKARPKSFCSTLAASPVFFISARWHINPVTITTTPDLQYTQVTKDYKCCLNFTGYSKALCQTALTCFVLSLQASLLQHLSSSWSTKKQRTASLINCSRSDLSWSSLRDSSCNISNPLLTLCSSHAANRSADDDFNIIHH